MTLRKNLSVADRDKARKNSKQYTKTGRPAVPAKFYTENSRKKGRRQQYIAKGPLKSRRWVLSSSRAQIKGRTIPRRYLPKGLSKADRAKQKRSIEKGTRRPKVKSFASKKSGWTKKFHNKYGDRSLSWIYKNIISKAGVDKIKAKGIAAYYTGGSRPNQTPQSWWKARLYSVIMGGKARNVDRKIWDQYRK